MRLKSWATKVVRVLRKALEADKVGVFIADCLAMNQEVVLFLHQLLEYWFVKRASHSNKELGVLQVCRELIEGARLAAERLIEAIELFNIRHRYLLQFILSYKK